VKASTENALCSDAVVDSDANERRVPSENYLGELSCDSEVFEFSDFCLAGEKLIS